MTLNFSSTQIQFFLLTAVLAGLLLYKTKHVSRVFVTSLRVWLVLIGVLAAAGYLMDFAMMPPRIAIVLIPVLVFLFWFGFHPLSLKFARAFPQYILIGLQGFRIFVELLLVEIHKEGLISDVMTFHGRNFDIVVGATAPILAFLVYRNPNFNQKIVQVWNILGMLILTNVVVHGMLGAPTQFRVLMDEPANTAIAYFPYVYLPGFLVPLAYCLHIVSFKRARIESSIPSSS